MERTKYRKRINSLTGLRFWMIIIVVLSHLGCLSNGYPYSSFYNQFLDNAVMGVDFFFMLSGFGMMYSYGRSSLLTSIRGGYHFAVDRIKKIYPIYFASLIFDLPYTFLKSLEKGYTIGETIRNIGIKMMFCITLLQSSLGMKAMSWAMNNVCWFLSSLFMIYLISPYMIKMVRKIADRWINKAFVGTVCLTVFIYYLFFEIQSVSFFDDLNYGSPYFRFLFVLMGMMLERIYEQADKGEKKYGCLEYLSVIGAATWFFSRNQLKEYLCASRLIDILLCALLLLAIALGNGRIVRFLSRERCVMLGDISMYIFIIHFPIILYLDYLFDRYNIRIFLNNVTGIIEAVLIFVLTGIITGFVVKFKNRSSLNNS